MRIHLGGVDTRTAASQERPSSVIVVGGGMTRIAAADPELLPRPGRTRRCRTGSAIRPHARRRLLGMHAHGEWYTRDWIAWSPLAAIPLLPCMGRVG